MNASIREDLERLLPFRRGHFRFESGHHSDMWVDLELLCLRPEVVDRLAATLAARLATYDVEAVCGPLVEGAFVALMVAPKLGVLFTYAERFADHNSETLYSVAYRVPRALRPALRGKRVAIINDVTSAGSAVRGTYADLLTCDAQPVVIGTLAVLGEAARIYAAEKKVALEALASMPNEIWAPSDCPLCARGVQLGMASESFLADGERETRGA